MYRIGFILLAFVVVGCTPPARPPLCPYSAVMATLERAPLEGNNLYLTGLSETCTRGDETEEWRVSITLTGRADSFYAGTYPIFVALMDKAGQIRGYSKRDIEINGTEFKVALPPFVQYRADDAEPRTFRNSNIFVGWALDDSQLSANRDVWRKEIFPQK
ncbi:MAG: hypothetical protein HAW65_04620 [Alphaproteobacteria bacterium]|nr:hypothetical protein [Alphaproteobacteria bacterium]MBE8220571.1 hypothetical protein [Alphaproteobacteria bacterium]